MTELTRLTAIAKDAESKAREAHTHMLNCIAAGHLDKAAQFKQAKEQQLLRYDNTMRVIESDYLGGERI